MNKIFMLRAIQIAKCFAENVKTNPTVGAVIVCDDKIIGEGTHVFYGSHHAEVNAIQSVLPIHLPLLKKSTIYITLEPCFHFGKTPPCVNLILEYQIPNVVIACIDPNPLVAGKSIELLKANGVQVATDIMHEEGMKLIQPFLAGIKHQRPYIILKYAQSKDLLIGRWDESVWLTNTFSKHLVHRWRSEVDAILIGKNTVMVDNPSLTNRLYYGKNPIRVLIDKNLEIPNSASIYNKEATTYVFNNLINKDKDTTFFVKMQYDEHFLTNILRFLYEKNIGQLIVEGGSYTLNRFIENGLWDEARVFTTEKVLGTGIAAPKMPENSLSESFRIDNDRLDLYFNTNPNF